MLFVVVVFVLFGGGFCDDNAPCQCVDAKVCLDNDEAVAGIGQLDVRMGRVCSNPQEVCCETLATNCGQPIKIGLLARITSGASSALFAELPWTAAILVRDVTLGGDRNVFRCGGSLIHPQVVLTAAHCVIDHPAEVITVRLGEFNTRAQDEPLPHQDRAVTEVISHPSFRAGSLKNDVSLLVLGAPVVLMDNVGLICLPNKEMSFGKARCVASGWGKDAFKSGRHSSVLKKIELPLVERDFCQKALRATRLGSFYHLHKSFLCAGGESNRDTCKGDGGSPLVCLTGRNDSQVFVQVGIVSWGIGCGEAEVPGVYVNVALFVDWIDKQLAERQLDHTVYKI